MVLEGFSLLAHLNWKRNSTLTAGCQSALVKNHTLQPRNKTPPVHSVAAAYPSKDKTHDSFVEHLSLSPVREQCPCFLFPEWVNGRGPGIPQGHSLQIIDKTRILIHYAPGREQLREPLIGLGIRYNEVLPKPSSPLEAGKRFTI